MAESGKKQVTPEDVIMNCLAGAERIDKIVILTFSKDKVHEAWSNNLASFERIGLLSVALTRVNNEVKELEEID